MLAARCCPRRGYIAIVAPIIHGGATANPVMLAAADPLAWTRAPLFIAQPDHTPAVDPVQGGRAADDGLAASPVGDISAIAP